MKNGEREKTDGLVGLARETADALGRLTVQHLRLARLEIKADLRAMGLQAGLIVVLAALATVGYGLTLAGLAVIFGGATALGMPLLTIGLVHVLGGGVGILLVVSHLRRSHLMNATAAEVGESLASLEGASTTDPMSTRTGASP